MQKPQFSLAKRKFLWYNSITSKRMKRGDSGVGY
nr:MAG TPA: hypothetical protein [Caudoviricetes sp.]